jgi:hypothetical protein
MFGRRICAAFVAHSPREEDTMRKVIVGCGVFVIGFMLAFATSTASAKPEAPSKRTPPRIEKPKPNPNPSAPQCLCLPPRTGC